MDLHDLPPKYDPKGGSPRTPPGGVRLADYQEYASPILPHQNGTIWKVAASGFAGLFVSMTIAWWTAKGDKGITRAEMEDYVVKYSPYTQDQKLLTEHNQAQDEKLGILRGQVDRIFTLINTNTEDHIKYDNKFTDLYKKTDTIAIYLEEEKKGKR